MNKSFPLDWKKSYWPEPRFGSKRSLVSDLGKLKAKEQRSDLREVRAKALLRRLADVD